MSYKTKEELKEYNHQHYLKNKERYLAKSKEWAKKHPEEIKAIKDKWLENNPEKRLEARRKWDETNKERKLAYGRQYRKENFLKIREYHERTRFNGNATITNQSCFMCGDYYEKKLMNIHHKDGKNGYKGKLLNNSSDNLVVLCVYCHRKVHSRGRLKEVIPYEKLNR